MDVLGLRLLRHVALVLVLSSVTGLAAVAQTPTPAPATPEVKSPPSATPPTPAPASPGTTKTPEASPPAAASRTPDAKAPDAKTPANKTPDADAPGKPDNTEIEPNGSPGIPDNATTESVTVPAREIVMVTGKSSYDDAFKSIKASVTSVKAAMDKAGLKPTGHPITIFSEPDDKGFKYKAGIPSAEKPGSQIDLGSGVSISTTPAGKAIKFQHRGAYDDIDSTYDVITAYLDAKGLQVDNPYIEEYLTDLTTPDDPNLQVDIYVFVK